MEHSLLSFLLFLAFFFSVVDAERPPKSYCTPHATLIRYITNAPGGRPFCVSLNSAPKTKTNFGLVTVTATITQTALKTITLSTRSGVTQTNYTTYTTTSVTTATSTSVINVTNTATATAISTVIKIATVTVTTTVAAPTKPGGLGSLATVTVRNPEWFPVALSDLSYASNLGLADDPWPRFLSGIASTSVSSACDCIVGYPTSTVTQTEQSTVTATTAITKTDTSTVTSVQLMTSSTMLWSNISLTSTTRTTVHYTNRTLTTAMTTVLRTLTSTVTATATAFPDCAKGYASTGYAGTGNKVLISSVEGQGPLACCNKCQTTPNCVASQLVGWLCQLLVNDVAVDGDPVTPMCPLGAEEFVFEANGPVFAGPCGY